MEPRALDAAGRTILANGPDEYRLGRRAAEWLKEYNRTFPGRRERARQAGGSVRRARRI